jgi:hypothetical protein
MFLNTLYLQEVRGYPAVRAGLFTLPMAAMIVVRAPLSGRIVGARAGRRSPSAMEVLTARGKRPAR